MPVCLSVCGSDESSRNSARNLKFWKQFQDNCGMCRVLRSKYAHGIAVCPLYFNTMLTWFLGETVEHRVQHSTTRWQIGKDAWFAVWIKKSEYERGRGVARDDCHQKKSDFPHAVFIRKMLFDSMCYILLRSCWCWLENIKLGFLRLL
jgi:hypothetical protein